MDQPKLYRVAREGHKWSDVLPVGTLVLARPAEAGEWCAIGTPALLVVPIEGRIARPHIIASRILGEHVPVLTRAPVFVYDPAVLEEVQ